MENSAKTTVGIQGLNSIGIPGGTLWGFLVEHIEGLPEELLENFLVVLLEEFYMQQRNCR